MKHVLAASIAAVMSCTPPPRPPTSTQTSAAVFDAIHARDVEKLTRVLDHDPQLASARDAKGMSPTLAALFQINADEETFAAPKDNALLHAVTAHRPTLDVFDAAAVGDVARLRQLIDANAALVDAFQPALGVTPLHLASFAGQLPAMELLLASGESVNVVSKNIFHNTPLILATLTSQHDAASLLLAKGADPNVSEKGGERALHIAAEADDAAMIRLLLDHGAKPDVTTDDGLTPLDVARKKGRAGAERELEASRRSQ